LSVRAGATHPGRTGQKGRMKKVSFIFGTRPEAIKLSPIILAMRADGSLQAHVCVTAQHRQMLDQMLRVFDIVPDVDLDLMRPNQTLAELTSRAITAVDGYLAACRPDLILVQGDTTTVFCASLCGFYRRIPVGHVEAGLRTWNKFAPYPEEINRVLTTCVADHHFAPTIWSRDNLLREHVPAASIHVTGNTVIDALLMAVEKIRVSRPMVPGLAEEVLKNGQPMVLITGHRRESFGEGFESICRAIATLAERFSRTSFVYPVHMNSNVREPVYRVLGQVRNVHLIEPQDYLPFVTLMERATVILTDSGGVQEEAPALGKPVLVMRDTTERPEAIESGAAQLVGTDTTRIVEAVSALLEDPAACHRTGGSPYGDGRAAGRILAACKDILRGQP
jgi:UDP-N-acetylglucosamine 2-epimerase (non-hydrolysing)